MKYFSGDAVRQFEEAGFLYPVSITSEAEANEYRASLEAYERELGHPVQGPLRTTCLRSEFHR